jgi:hypothetical protein
LREALVESEYQATGRLLGEQAVDKVAKADEGLVGLLI